MRNKIKYHLIKLISKRAALDFAIDQQIKSMKRKNEIEWYYWYTKIKW